MNNEIHDALMKLRHEDCNEKCGHPCETMNKFHMEVHDLIKSLSAENRNLQDSCTDLEARSALLSAEGARKDATIEAIQAFIDAQAEDEGLWCEAEHASEAYIQRGLRGCHAYIESVIKDGPKPVSGR